MYIIMISILCATVRRDGNKSKTKTYKIQDKTRGVTKYTPLRIGYRDLLIRRTAQ